MFLFAFPKSVFADLGPVSVYPQGGLVQTNSQTAVSMEYEKVILTYSNPQLGKLVGEGPRLNVHVSAVFKMFNTGTADETIPVFFPADDSVYLEGYKPEEVKNFKVNGQLLDNAHRNKLSVMIDYEPKQLAVYQWEERFPAQTEKEITIEYDTFSQRDFYDYPLTYVLGTGASWHGPIKAGEIRFVMPVNLPEYAVLEGPRAKGNTDLSYTISGNEIIFTLENYEPEPWEAIGLGVFDFEIVSRIEQLKQQPRTFENILEIAENFSTLAIGGHCHFCMGEAGLLARDYYYQALAKADSKERVHEVLLSFMYREHKTEEKAIQDVSDAFSFAGCREDDDTCRAVSFEYLSKYVVPYYFGYRTDTPGIMNQGFLEAVILKFDKYDSEYATILRNFIAEGRAISLEQIEYYKQHPRSAEHPTSPIPEPQVATQPLEAKRSFIDELLTRSSLLIGIGSGFLLALFGIKGAPILFERFKTRISK